MRKWLNLPIIWLMLLAACQQETTNSVLSLPTAQIKLHAPEGTHVGKPIQFYLKTTEPTTAEFSLLVESAMAIHSTTIIANTKIDLPQTWFLDAGIYNLIAHSHDVVVANRKVLVKAGPVTSLELYAGPNTILVGGKQESMVVTIPSDAHDNAYPGPEQVSFRSDLGDRAAEKTAINHLIANKTIISDTINRKQIIGISMDHISSIEQTIEEIADWSSDFSIEVVRHYPYADGRQYTRLRTSNLKDKYGNQVADGTLVIYEVSELGLTTGRYQAICIDGVANVYIRNPIKATTLTITANIGEAATSPALNLGYSSIISEIITQIDTQTNELQIGPLTSTLGQFIPDGTLVLITYDDGVPVALETKDGRATYDLVHIIDKSINQIKVEVGGLTKTIKL